MPGYQTPYDIANRACQHCRADRITSFSDYSAAAQEIGFAYDKIREAELRRRNWRFSIRRAVLRAIDTTTLLWTPPTYDATTAYSAGQVVVDSNSEWWQAKAASTGQTPAAGVYWSHYFGPDTMETFTADALTFNTGELTSSGGVVYLSLANGNTDTPPSSNWLAVNGTTATLQIFYPLGTGPRVDQTSANAFRLPHGYLRRAPSEPKGGHYYYDGVALGPPQEDWVFDGDYIISRDSGPLMLRFVANMVDVTDFDPMFCEALGARIAQECASRIVQPQDGWTVQDAVRQANAHYRDEISQAGIVNGIESGAVSPMVDDWITVRF